MENLDIYNAAKAVPSAAQKKITGGRLNGMTDINPMWRIQKLTELFGPVGIGWYYEIANVQLEPGAAGEVTAFVYINLYIKNGDSEWSKPIPGVGGSMYISNEKNGARTSDEAIKMATTDAMSVACKALGIGADVYWAAGAVTNTTSKYNEKPRQSTQTQSTQTQTAKPNEVPSVGSDDLPAPTSKAKVKPASLEEAEAVKVTEGDYAGKTLKEVYATNKEDLRTLAGASTDKYFRNCCVAVYNGKVA